MFPTTARLTAGLVSALAVGAQCKASQPDIGISRPYDEHD